MTSDTPVDTSSECPAASSDEMRDNLAAWEVMFANRFTEDDPHFKPYIDTEPDLPPIVENYYVRKQRPYDKYVIKI